MKEEFINGPLNTFRLEGDIFGVHKVLYVFMDVHMSVTEQTKCESIKAIDVANYLVNSFDELSKTSRDVDFFFEITPTELNKKHKNIRKKRYIDEVDDIFTNAFYYDEKTVTVGKSNTFPNVRLHYIDIRDYFYNAIHKQLNDLYYVDDQFETTNIIHKNVIDMIINRLNAIKFMLDEFLHLLTKNTKYKSDIPVIPPKSIDILNQKQVFDKSSELINKIKTKYTHKEAKKLINNMIDDELIKKINYCISGITKYSQELIIDARELIHDPLKVSSYNDKIIFGQQNNVADDIKRKYFDFMEDIKYTTMNIFSNLVDIFFLRRFIDKDYITNGLVYTGSYHSATYIHTLVKHLNFKITNASYLRKGYDLNKLMTLIKKEKNGAAIRKHIYPESLMQCSNMSSFPKLFI